MCSYARKANSRIYIYLSYIEFKQNYFVSICIREAGDDTIPLFFNLCGRIVSTGTWYWYLMMSTCYSE